MNGYYEQVTKILKLHGYARLRQGKGSHEIWARDGKSGVTVATTVKSRHTANAVLKQAGLNEKI
jgi:predicted RNA binding protein YcfA (HicA-like mRNA interferase family)